MTIIVKLRCKHIWFLVQLLKWPEIVWDAEIKRLVRTILSILIRSAEAERGELDYFGGTKYADKWIKANHYATDNPVNKKKESLISYSLREEENLEQKKRYFLKSTIF